MNIQHPDLNGIGELQGLYGPLQVLEGKIQQVWALQEMQYGNWKTRNGRRLRVLRAGSWNHGAGPDFAEAVIEVDGCRIAGDVEIHLYREDWWRHGHHMDPRYADVVLHVVLFAGGMDRPIQTVCGSQPEEWILGPWMREDIEAVSGGEPGLFGELVPEVQEWLESDQPEQVRQRLQVGSDRRWQQKEAMSRCLVQEYGFAGAAHRMLLYYLGFPYNRRAFFQLADCLPPEQWANPFIIETVKDDWGEHIQWGAGRPANRAEQRLHQYGNLNRLAPGWIGALSSVPGELLLPLRQVLAGRAVQDGTRDFRTRAHYAAWMCWVTDEVFRGLLPPTLVDRLWIDVLLPLLVANNVLAMEAAGPLWYHARPGSFPDVYRRLLKLVGIGGPSPRMLCNGWVQGLLWAEDQLRTERLRSSLGHSDSSSLAGGA